MKKDVTETKVFCDYCEEPGYTKCLMCDKDLCPNHRLELLIYLERQNYPFRASLCPVDAQPLLPLLESWKAKSTTWEKAGQNPEFNEARLAEILDFLKKAVPAA